MSGFDAWRDCVPTDTLETSLLFSDRAWKPIEISDPHQRFAREKRFFKGLAVPFYVENSQRYYCLDLHDYAVFFSISKPQNSTNRLKLRIISTYEVAEWGRLKLPKGKPHNVRYILEMRNAGKSI